RASQEGSALIRQVEPARRGASLREASPMGPIQDESQPAWHATEAGEARCVHRPLDERRCSPRGAFPAAEGDGVMPSGELVGRRVRIIAWYDHVPLIAARRTGDLMGTITHVKDSWHGVSVSVRVDRPFGEYAFTLRDVALLSS